jgi:ABC-type amino acid transport substrate-binding protein
MFGGAMPKDFSRRQFLGFAASSAAVVGLGLVGCGSSASSSSNTSDSNSTSFSKSSYVVATDTTFAPFEFTNDSNEFVGIDVDLLSSIASDTGFSYDLQSLGFDAAVAALESGQADAVIAGMSITDARKEKYDFSDPYYDSYVCMAVKSGSDITGYSDLSGKTVAAKTGTQGATCAESLKDQYGFSITYFDESSMMYQDVLTGNSVSCFEDYPVMAYGISQGNGLEIITEEKEDYSTPYGFAVMKGQNSDLLDAFNKGLSDLKDNGGYDDIINKYLQS